MQGDGRRYRYLGTSTTEDLSNVCADCSAHCGGDIELHAVSSAIIHDQGKFQQPAP